MTNFQRFSTKEIPFDILDKFGISQEMFDDLPQSVIERVQQGRTTPVLPVTIVNVEGKTVQAQARISLVRLPDGTVDVCFAPRWDNVDLSDFNEEQKQKLMLGQVTTATIPGKGNCYIQFDEAVSQVMVVPVSIINQNFSLMTHSIDFSDNELQQLKEGSVVELNNNDDTVSIGVDLFELTGIRIANGDTMTWYEDFKADRLPKYNFGIFGCWIADNDNCLTYVREDDYTEEILKEMERAGKQNATREQMNQLKYN